MSLLEVLAIRDGLMSLPHNFSKSQIHFDNFCNLPDNDSLPDDPVIERLSIERKLDVINLIYINHQALTAFLTGFYNTFSVL